MKTNTNSINNEIHQYLILKIVNPSWDINCSIPSENFLVQKFKTNRSTVRIVLQKLINQGIIYAKKGRGYFVNPYFAFAKLNAVGKKENIMVRKIFDYHLPYNPYFFDIISKLKIDQTSINLTDYVGYTKTFYNFKNQPIIYINSFINKKTIGEQVKWTSIENSLLTYLKVSNVKLSYQANKLLLQKANNLDKKILHIKHELVPVNYGCLVDEEHNYIEFFEKHFSLDDFEVDFFKFYLD